jgi:hypothetical protein
MDYRQALFLRKVQDLRERAESNDWFLVLGCAALLRHLLFDKHCLTGQANTGGVKYRFTVCVEPDPDPMPMVWAPIDGIDPEGGGRHLSPVSLNVDKFKALTLMVANGERHTVKSFVRLAAHIDGAIHTGEPKTEEEARLKEWTDLINYRRSLPSTPAARG